MSIAAAPLDSPGREQLAQGGGQGRPGVGIDRLVAWCRDVGVEVVRRSLFGLR
jgi:hypothetical protein